MNEYYIYRHLRNDTKCPFYVGKGKNKRAWVKQHRNKHWHNIVNKYGYTVEIILEDLTDERAFEKEREFIKLYKSCGYCRANYSDGGEGCSGESNFMWKNGKIREGKNNTNWNGRWRTPYGDFDTAIDASRVCGVHSTTVRYRCRTSKEAKWKAWSYEGGSRRYRK